MTTSDRAIALCHSFVGLMNSRRAGHPRRVARGAWRGLFRARARARTFCEWRRGRFWYRSARARGIRCEDPSVIVGVIVGPRWHLYGPGYARFRTFSIEVNARKGHSRARRRIVLVDVPNYL